MTVTFGCGHVLKLEDSVTTRPRCQVCGESCIRHTQAPPPRFKGHCTGPSAEMKPLEPWSQKLEQ
jgi:hypothetical protein